MDSELIPEDFKTIYASFKSPVIELDCGRKCAPYNQRGVPFCCDTRHAVPVAYLPEWAYLKTNTDLWHLWEGESPTESTQLREKAPDGMVPIECMGHEYCQREYRSITCRAFPFFPYITEEGEFIGLTYYWEYEDRCWVISNLQIVDPKYREQFFITYDVLLKNVASERESFRYQSELMREEFREQGREIPIFHRDGGTYYISPNTGRKRQIDIEGLPKFGPYKVAVKMPFPDEK